MRIRRRRESTAVKQVSKQSEMLINWREKKRNEKRHACVCVCRCDVCTERTRERELRKQQHQMGVCALGGGGRGRMDVHHSYNKDARKKKEEQKHVT